MVKINKGFLLCQDSTFKVVVAMGIWDLWYEVQNFLDGVLGESLEFQF